MFKARSGWGVVLARPPPSKHSNCRRTCHPQSFDMEGMPICGECFTGVFLCSDSCTYHECACGLNLHICIWSFALMNESMNCDQTKICPNAWMPPWKKPSTLKRSPMHRSRDMYIDTPIICILCTHLHLPAHVHIDIQHMNTLWILVIYSYLLFEHFKVHLTQSGCWDRWPFGVSVRHWGSYIWVMLSGAPWSTGRIAEAEGTAGRRAANVPRCNGTQRGNAVAAIELWCNLDLTGSKRFGDSESNSLCRHQAGLFWWYSLLFVYRIVSN